MSAADEREPQTVVDLLWQQRERYAELLRELIATHRIADVARGEDAQCRYCFEPWPETRWLGILDLRQTHERHEPRCIIARVRRALEETDG